jgi:hypothetical protein
MEVQFRELLALGVSVIAGTAFGLELAAALELREPLRAACSVGVGILMGVPVSFAIARRMNGRVH